MAEWRARGRRSSGGRPSPPLALERGGSGSWGARGGSYAAGRSRRSSSPGWPARKEEAGSESAEFSFRSADMRSRRSDVDEGPRRPGESGRWPSGNPRRPESGLRRRDSVDQSVGRTRDESDSEGRRAEGERFPRAVDDARRTGSARSVASQPRSRDSDYVLADKYRRSFDAGDRMQVRGISGSLRRDSPPRRLPDDSSFRRDVDIGALGGDSSYATDDLTKSSVEEHVVRRTEDRHIWSQNDRHVRNVAAAAERFRERPRRTDDYERRSIESPTRPTQTLQQRTRERRVDNPTDPPVGDTWQARESLAGIGPKLGRTSPRHASDEYRGRRMDVGTGTGHAYRVERADRSGDVDDFQRSYIPEKIRLDPGSPHHSDEYIAVDRRLMTDSKAYVNSSRERRAPFDKEWRSPKQEVDVFRGRSRERSTEDAKRSYSRESPRSDSRHTDKTGVRTDRFDRDSMHSLPAIAAQQDSMRDLMGTDERYRSMSPTPTTVPRSPLSGDDDFKIIPDVYADADTVLDFDFDASGRATKNDEHDERNVPRHSFSNRHDGDAIKGTSRNHYDTRPASPLRKRRAGIDLREEVLGGRRYRGMEVAVVQDVVSHSEPGHVGNYRVPDAPLNSRAARPELPGSTRPSLKRSRSSSLGRAAVHRTTPVASREAPTATRVGTARQKYVIERMHSEEDRIRSFARGLRPEDFSSNQEIDRSVQQLWTGFCRRTLDVDAVPLNYLKLEYLNAYFDVLKSTYPHFAEYYRVCKQEVLVSSDRYSPVEKKRVHSGEAQRARHLPPTSKTVEHGRAALLLKRAKEQKLAVYRNSASTKTAELESNFSGVSHRDVRLARQQSAVTSLPRRSFGSAPAAATARHGNVRPATGNVVRLAARRRNDGEPAMAKNPAARPSKMLPPSAQDGGATSEPIDSGRTSTVAGSTAGHASGGKSTRPSAKESESQLSDNAPDRLQGTSLVAVADAAAATSGKAVFDDPFMKFLHTTLTAMIVIGELQRQQISGRLTAHHSKSLADERAKMEERMRTDMGHRLIKLARYIQQGDLNSARETLSISENVLNTVANLDPVVIRTIACTPLLR